MTLTKNKIIIFFLVLVALIWKVFDVGFDAGFNQANASFSDSVKEIELKHEQEKAALNDKLARLDTDYTREKSNLQTKIEKLKIEAAKYEPPQNTDCNCSNLDPEWVRLHNRGADLSGVRNPDATSVVNGKTEGTTKNRALETITGNYASCARYITQLEGLQAFVRTLKDK